MVPFEELTNKVIEHFKTAAKKYNVKVSDIKVISVPWTDHFEEVDEYDIPYNISGWILISGCIEYKQISKNFVLKAIHSSKLVKVDFDFLDLPVGKIVNSFVNSVIMEVKSDESV